MSVGVILVALSDKMVEATVNYGKWAFHVKQQLEQKIEKVELGLDQLSQKLNELLAQEIITDPAQLDKDGNYELQHEPISLSTVVYAGAVTQLEGKNFLVEGKKVILNEWWRSAI